MDVGACANVSKYSNLAKANNIKVPGLRGYRLMSEENFINWESVCECEKVDVIICKDILRTEYIHDIPMTAICERTDRRIKKYIKNDVIQWHLLHGKLRRDIKFGIKKMKKAIKAQCALFNGYVGVPNVLYICAKIGGWRWSENRNLEHEPWFLNKIDDSFDNSYCNIYAKIEGGC